MKLRGDSGEEEEYTEFGSDFNNITEKYKYTGKEKDATGLYYYGARYYDPAIGRFITRDPVKGSIMNPQTLNPYVYCLNNPLKYIDPDGESPWDHKWLPDGDVEIDPATWDTFYDPELREKYYDEWAQDPESEWGKYERRKARIRKGVRMMNMLDELSWQEMSKQLGGILPPEEIAELQEELYGTKYPNRDARFKINGTSPLGAGSRVAGAITIGLAKKGASKLIPIVGWCYAAWDAYYDVVNSFYLRGEWRPIGKGVWENKYTGEIITEEEAYG